MSLSAAAGSLLSRGDLAAAPLVNGGALPRSRAGTASAGAVESRQTLGLVYDRECLLWEGPPVGTYWEKPNRLQAIAERLNETGFRLEKETIRPASFEQIARAHTPRYVRYIQKVDYLPQEEFAWIRRVDRRYVNRPATIAGAAGTGGSTPRYEHMVQYIHPPAETPKYRKIKPFEAAALAAGGAIQAVDQVMSGKTQTSFALVRPPGHHATRSRNMGFCVFNNAAVAARHAQATHGAKRVLVLDWDVHHGNGTQEIFYTDPSVLYFSTHQEGIYPKRTGKVHEVGAGSGRGYNVNVPMPPGTGDAGFMRVFHELLVPVAQAFKPDLIIVSAGQDAHAHDFVASMRVSDEGFAQMTKLVKEMARELCGSKLVFVLEGGYNPRVTARAVETIVRTLNTPDQSVSSLAAIQARGHVSSALSARIEQVKQAQSPYWAVLA